MIQYQATIVWSTDEARDVAIEHLCKAIKTHPSYSLIPDSVRVQPMQDVEESARTAKDLAMRASVEMRSLKAENEHLDRKLRAETQRAMDISMQLEKLAQHKNAVLAPESDAVFKLMEECEQLNKKCLDLEQRAAFLEGERTSNFARFEEMRDQIFELRAGIAPELVALEAERDFWRDKAKAFLKKR